MPRGKTPGSAFGAAASTGTIDDAQRAARAGDLARAKTICQAILARRRRDVGALALLASIRLAEGRYHDAADLAKRAASAQPKVARHHATLAQAHARLGRYDDALRGFDKALRLDPRDPLVLARKADLLHAAGRTDEALALFDDRRAPGRDDPLLADAHARLLLSVGDAERAAQAAAAFADAPDLSAQTRRSLLGTLGRALERLDRHDEAFAVHRTRHEHDAVAYDPDEFTRFVDRVVGTFSPDALARFPRASEASETAVFIVGMPRSGSTLVEHILDAHPDAAGIGESPVVDSIVNEAIFEVGATEPYPAGVRFFDRRAADFLARRLDTLLREREPRAARVVDKQLFNFRHLGLLEMIAPGAKVVHTTRDPLDTCLSCYTTNLSPTLMPFTADLEHLGRYHRDYRRLMNHWRDVLAIPTLDLAYEDLVRDPEAASRRLVEFVGLPWDERCLRFHESSRHVATASADQVNRPIYRDALGRARRYGRHLDPLRRALAE